MNYESEVSKLNHYNKDEEEKRVTKLADDKRLENAEKIIRQLYYDTTNGSKEEALYQDFINLFDALRDELAKIDNESATVCIGRVLALKSTVASKTNTNLCKVLTHFSDGQDMFDYFDGSSEENLPTVYSLSSNDQIEKRYEAYDGALIPVFIYLDTSNGTYHLSGQKH